MVGQNFSRAGAERFPTFPIPALETPCWSPRSAAPYRRQVLSLAPCPPKINSTEGYRAVGQVQPRQPKANETANNLSRRNVFIILHCSNIILFLKRTQVRDF